MYSINNLIEGSQYHSFQNTEHDNPNVKTKSRRTVGHLNIRSFNKITKNGQTSA